MSVSSEGHVYVYMWQYRVRPDALGQFLEHYTTDGRWADLFRASPGYEGTVLLRDATDDHLFVTIDSWSTQSHYEDFLARHASEFEAPDGLCEQFTEWEKRIGSYLSVSPSNV